MGEVSHDAAAGAVIGAIGLFMAAVPGLGPAAIVPAAVGGVVGVFEGRNETQKEANTSIPAPNTSLLRGGVTSRL
jgi:hypothetical protein